MTNSTSSALQTEATVIIEALAADAEALAPLTATGVLYMLPGGIFHELQDSRGTLYYAAVVDGKVACCLDLDEAREVRAS